MSNGINIDLTANLARWTSSLDRATQDLNRFQTNTQRIAGSINSAFSGLGVAIGVGTFSALVKGSIDAADNLKDLSRVTGISVEQLSGLKLAANQSGTNLEQVANAINKLSVNIGKNGEKFRQLGIDAKDPLEAFAQLADIFNAIENPQQRAALAATALGKSWQDTAPLLAEGGASIRAMVADGTKLSGVTTEMANRADAFNDQVERMKAGLGGLVVSVIGPVLEGFSQLAAKISEASGKVATFNSVLTGIGNFAFNSEGVRGLSVEIDNINNKIVAQKEKIDRLKDGGGIFALLSNADINEEKNKLDELYKARETALRQLQLERAKTQAVTALPSNNQINTFIGGQSSAGATQRPALSSARVKLDRQDLAIYREFDDILAEGDRLALSQRNSLFDLTKQAELLKAELADLAPPPSGEFERRLFKIDDALKQGIFSAKEAKVEFDNLVKQQNEGSFDDTQIKDKVSAVSEFAIQASRNLQSSLAGAIKTGFQGGLDDALASFGNFLADAAAQAAASQLLEIFSGKDGKSGLLGTIFGSIFKSVSGARASGGPVGSGQTYLVGEKGPELFTPSSSGSIIPNGGFSNRSGGNVYNVSVAVQQNSNDSPDKTGSKIAESLIRAISREEIKNANRPGNTLNKVTNFG